MSLDLDRITHPPRLARGSYQPGSGKGCAMNVISYINGDTEITDFPECSARPLAWIIQSLNDNLAGPDEFLSPENSVIVLDLGWQTMGTADTPRKVVWQWLIDVLVDPEWGIVRHARRPNDAVTIHQNAALYMRMARDERVSVTERHKAWRISIVAATYATIATAADAIHGLHQTTRIEFTRWAIQHWRELAGLNEPTNIDASAVNSALAQIAK